jgi:hypothetical protein
MQSWATHEFRYVHLGDARLNKRLVKMVEDLSSQPDSSVPQACGDWASTKGAYEFWKNPKVKPDSIIVAHEQSTMERLSGHDVVINIQDTTDLNFTGHAKKQGMGHLDHPSAKGLKVHSCLVVSEHGVPQGLIHQHVWSRDPRTVGKKHKRRKLKIKDKESQRWLDALSASQDAIPSDKQVITVADREADIYDLFALPRREDSHLLIRMSYNRRVEHDAGDAKHLWKAVRQSAILGEVTVDIGRKGGQLPRKATLTIRIASLSICPPSNRSDRASLPAIPVHMVLAEEDAPQELPSGVKPVCWLLLATFPVETFDDAVRCLRYYSYRWLIERYHFVLKSGCGLEKLQLETADRIHRALATYCIVAWRLLWLTYEARYAPDSPCDKVLETYEWQSLYCYTHKTSVPPETPLSLHEAVVLIAKLGGFLARKSDGEPGVKTIWRGLRRLHDIASTWALLHAAYPDAVGAVDT